MATVGSYQLKTNLAQFLDRVTAGETIEVTRHGVTIAKLVPLRPQAKYKKRDVATMLKRISRVKLRGTSIQSLIDHGRKY